ncbi:hypothetical protein K493DRAFT_108543 [Basidiobolus meristosporus CBS 931.73]|uniref:Uncharacterized protein n=1 Tax=Basidiobolus meristosporus CBS 931.73 TaxID=1314790 RepID=A0A1Y1YPQ8_9FUNG|nr:hypothetical protein K493DRAFT_108543 [Basidiobolus meristosporus CBS 931.73]|eukprot:ORX99746.1 hypothetical protein K493DRAFT_108543 [Basidiobolus meristosporus CBS 931.73]
MSSICQLLIPSTKLLEDPPLLKAGEVEGDKASPTESLDEDAGYDRVCNMLDHLLNDAKAAINTESPLDISYSEDLDEELTSSASLITPVRSELREKKEKEQMEVAPKTPYFEPPLPTGSIKKNTTELRFWCQVVKDGEEQEPYQIQRKLVLPNITPRKKSSTRSLDSASGQISCAEPAGIYDQSKTVMSMIYWTLLFTLGALLLDRYLIELASAQVANAMEYISPDRQVEFMELSESEDEDQDAREIEYTMGDTDNETPLRRRRVRRYSM